MTSLAHEQPATATLLDPFLECDTTAECGPPTASILDPRAYSICPEDLQLYLRAIAGDISDFTDQRFHLSDEAKEILATEISFLKYMIDLSSDIGEKSFLRSEVELLMTAYLMCQRGDAPDRGIVPEISTTNTGSQSKKRRFTRRVFDLLNI